MLREALDPTQPGGAMITLPDDPELSADLSVLHFSIDSRGISITKKDDVRDVLGRSPDKGDAVAMAWFAGAKGTNVPEDWAKHVSDSSFRKQQPVIMKRLKWRK